MRRLAWLLIPMSLAACGSSKIVGTISVKCDGGTELCTVRRRSTCLATTVDGRPTISFADPANPGKTGTISVPPHGRCKVSTESKL